MKSEQNRQRIVESAQRLFSERGYAGTSIGDVAERAGLLKGNLSYYYKTKAELLNGVTLAKQQELLGKLTAGLAADASAMDCLEHFLRVTDAEAEVLASVGCPVGTLCSELGKDDSALQPYAARILQSLNAWLTHQFARLMPDAAAAECAEQLLAQLQGAAVLAHAYRDAAVVHRQVRQARAWLKLLSAQNAPRRAGARRRP